MTIAAGNSGAIPAGSLASSTTKVSRADSPRRHKTVRFHNKIRIRNVSNHRKRNRQERKSYWYSGQEFFRMKEESIELIKMQTQDNTDLEELQALGLESADHCKARRNRIQQAKLAVLVEQERLWKEQAPLHAQTECLAIRSQWASQIGRDEALRRARIIATQVYGYCSSISHSYPRYYHCYGNYYNHGGLCTSLSFGQSPNVGGKTTLQTPRYVESQGRRLVLPVVLSQKGMSQSAPRI